MSRSAEVELAFGDGQYLFRLPVGQLRELQEKCACGPMPILQRLSSSAWRIDDVRETIRLGLIGGGMTPPAALKLVERYVDARPWGECVPTAQAVLLAAVIGAGDQDDPVGKAEGAETQSQPTG